MGSDGNNGGFDGLFRELPNYPAYQFAGSFPLLFPLINQTPSVVIELWVTDSLARVFIELKCDREIEWKGREAPDKCQL